MPAWDGSEGQRFRLRLSPGAVAVRSMDPARAERLAERTASARRKSVDIASLDLGLERRLEDAHQLEDAAVHVAASGAGSWSDVDELAADVEYLEGRILTRDREPSPAGPGVTVWSRKSRARMVRTLAELDYAPLFVGGGVPAMLTLTYPGDWLTVAGSAVVCKRQVDNFKRAYLRAWGVKLVGVWKREFQRRGAPHYHVLMVPPRGLSKGGQTFTEWVGPAWANVVGHPDPVERSKHAAAGTGVDFAEGMRARDPKRLAVYFSKHGAYASKEYQNHAPVQWSADGGSVGRFWGVWGLESAAVEVEVTPAEALAAARTMRRWQDANGYRASRTVRRRRWNTATGELRHAARCDRERCDGYCHTRQSGTWSGSKMRGHRGFVVVNDGAAFVSQLARYLDQVRPQDFLSDPPPASCQTEDSSVSVCFVCGSRLAADLVSKGLDRHAGDCSPDSVRTYVAQTRPASCDCGYC